MLRARQVVVPDDVRPAERPTFCGGKRFRSRSRRIGARPAAQGPACPDQPERTACGGELEPVDGRHIVLGGQVHPLNGACRRPGPTFCHLILRSNGKLQAIGPRNCSPGTGLLSCSPWRMRHDQRVKDADQAVDVLPARPVRSAGGAGVPSMPHGWWGGSSSGCQGLSGAVRGCRSCSCGGGGRRLGCRRAGGRC